jgi:hypothetical protein
LYSLKDIPVDDYFRYSLELKSQEIEMLQQLMGFLPDTIIDAHAHANTAAQVLAIDDGIYHHMMSTFPAFTLEQSQQCRAILYPGKSVKSLRFAGAFRGIDHRAANEYLVVNSPSEDRVALYGIPDDIDYTVGMLRSGKFTGLKMYYQYFNPPAWKIQEVFPLPILDLAQELGVPIILHLPRPITQSVEDLDQLLTNFPQLYVVLAHLGLPHIPVPGLLPAYEHFAQYPNVFMDTAMIPSREVVLMALKAFGSSRIMFGSDEPVNLIRSAAYHNPEKGERLVTEYMYHWVDPREHEQYKHLAADAIHAQWQALRAIQEAVEQLPSRVQKQASEAIFHGNARLVYRF